MLNNGGLQVTTATSPPNPTTLQLLPYLRPMPNDTSISINKFISETGLCSRREADKLLDAGRVRLNNKVARKGCTTDQRDKTNIIDFVDYPERIFPIGRLDKPSTGLILLTNNGDIVNKILRVENDHDKEYVVTVDKPINREFIKRMAGGLPILDQVTKKCEVEKLGKYKFRIILTQGLNRQIRRMCEYLGFEVQTLKRTRIMNVRLDGLPEGEWRELREDELEVLMALT
jgi:23S rRNA pseudouridine2604 synthase